MISFFNAGLQIRLSGFKALGKNTIYFYLSLYCILFSPRALNKTPDYFKPISTEDHFTAKPKLGLLQNLCQGPCRVSIVFEFFMESTPLTKNPQQAHFAACRKQWSGKFSVEDYFCRSPFVRVS
ncbi:MAG TPA: hypothetical protein PLV21_03490 [Cyclobacteriaceae bacterium]|nr:hypothetical protein [Cyclobacteriaceae bacterium]HRJ80921.1 hypothetical protein [Cyclobacteriaceae bacterium]